MQFPRQAYWSGLPFQPSGDLPDPGNESAPPASPTLVADSLPMNPLGSLPALLWSSIIEAEGKPGGWSTLGF